MDNSGILNKLKNVLNKKITVNIEFNKLISGKKLYLFAFFISSLIIFTAYMIFGIYPAGNSSVLTLDLGGQYVLYYENFRDALHGNGSLFNSWSKNLSGETMGIFAYYLASPFMLIVALLPRSIITESILIMQVLKVGTAAVTSCFYFRHSKKLSDHASLMFSLMYSLTTYMISNLMNIMWIDGLIWLPVICFGIECIINNGRCLIFVCSLAAALMSNFYIGYMIVIFCCIYFIAYYFFISDNKAAGFFRSGIKFALSGILAAACAAWVLLPTYFSLALGKFDFTKPDMSFHTQFNMIEFFANFLPNVYDSWNVYGSPLLYCGVLTILLVPIYFMDKDISVRKKIGYGIMAVILILSMFIRPLDIAWHGFQIPVALPYRYAFILSFICLSMAADVFNNINKVGIKKLACILVILFGYTIYMYIFHPRVTYETEKIRFGATVCFTIAASLIYAAIIYLSRKENRKRIVSAALTFCIISELVFTVTFNIYFVNGVTAYSSRDQYNKFISLGRDTVSHIYDMDNDIYRIEHTGDGDINAAMAFGSYGISHSSSTLNGRVVDFLRKMGFTHEGYRIKYKGDTYITDSIFGIKYIMKFMEIDDAETTDSNDLGFILSAILSKNNSGSADRVDQYENIVFTNNNEEIIVNVYEDPYALPIAFMADNSAADVHLESWEDPFENQNILFSSLISDEKQEFLKKIDTDTYYRNAEYSFSEDYHIYKTIDENQSADIFFDFTAPTDDMVYLFIPSDHEKKVSLYVNGDYLDVYLGGADKAGIMPLGRFKAGEKVSLRMNILNLTNEAVFKDCHIYYIDMKKFENAVNELKRQPLNITSFKEDHIIGNVTAEKDGLLFTSISYEPGWTILVDGVKTEPVPIADALIGIPMTAGEHSVEMKFFPKGLAAGIAVSAAGIVILVIIGVYENKKRKQLADNV